MNLEGVSEPRTRSPYRAEFRQQIVELACVGRTPAELSCEFGCSAQTIANWLAQAAIDAGKPLPGKDGLMTEERQELNRLRRENRQLKLKREILSKPAAWFANKDEKVRGRLRAREGRTRQNSDEHHVSRARRDGGRLLRVAWPRTVATRHAGPRARRAYPRAAQERSGAIYGSPNIHRGLVARPEGRRGPDPRDIGR